MFGEASTFDVALPLISGLLTTDGALTDIWAAGTGFVPAPGVVVSCWHCVRDPERSYALLWPSIDGRPERIVRIADITKDPRGLDLATGRVRLTPRFPYTFARHEPQGFADVLTVGFPLPDRTRDPGGRIVLEQSARALRGYVVRLFDNQRHAGFGAHPSYELDMPAPGGLSGAPLLVQGRGAISLVGVVYGSADTYTIAEQSEVDARTGEPSAEVRRYASFGLAHRLESLPGPRRRGDQWPDAGGTRSLALIGRARCRSMVPGRFRQPNMQRTQSLERPIPIAVRDWRCDCSAPRARLRDLGRSQQGLTGDSERALEGPGTPVGRPALGLASTLTLPDGGTARGGTLAKYRISEEERYALYTAHGGKCYQCSDPLTMKTVEVDHIIPESLVDDPNELERVRERLGRPAAFDVNSYENWAPTCHICNNAKNDMAWQPSLEVQRLLQRAEDRAPKAREVAEKFLTDRRIANALSVLVGLSETGEITADIKAELRPLIETFAEAQPPATDQEVVRVTSDYEVPLYRIVSDDGRIAIAEGPYGRGAGPSGVASSGMRCGVCGLPFFNGARCITCGNMDDGD